MPYGFPKLQSTTVAAFFSVGYKVPLQLYRFSHRQQHNSRHSKGFRSVSIDSILQTHSISGVPVY